MLVMVTVTVTVTVMVIVIPEQLEILSCAFPSYIDRPPALEYILTLTPFMNTRFFLALAGSSGYDQSGRRPVWEMTILILFFFLIFFFYFYFNFLIFLSIIFYIFYFNFQIFYYLSFFLQMFEPKTCPMRVPNNLLYVQIALTINCNFCVIVM